MVAKKGKMRSWSKIAGMVVMTALVLIGRRGCGRGEKKRWMKRRGNT